MSERVGDRQLQPARTASRGPVLPDASCWTIVVDDDRGPTAAVPPAGTGAAEELLVADASLPIADALGSQALRTLTDRTAVVVTSGGSIQGVWTGEDLVDAAMHGGTRSAGEALPGDIQLMGLPRKKDITRHCGYNRDGVACATVLVVPEKPEEMPACPPQDGIPPHTFEW